MRILHYADLHQGEYPGPVIDGTNGRFRDLEQMHARIADAARAQACDLAVFAGDAFKVRRPSFQEILSVARVLRAFHPIPVVAIAGNHDTPNDGSAGAWNLIQAMNIPGLTVYTEPGMSRVNTAAGPVQVFALPHLTRSVLLADDECRRLTLDEVGRLMSERAMQIVLGFAAERDPALPAVLVAHVSVSGAALSNDRQVFFGHEAVLPADELEALGFDYVALGHLHRAQQLSPRLFYSGNPERLDFGEAADPKGYYLAEVEPGREPVTRFCELPARRFVSFEADLATPEDARAWTEQDFPDSADAIVQVTFRASADTAKVVDRQALAKRLTVSGAYYVAGITAQVERPVRSRVADLKETVTLETALEKWLAQQTGLPPGVSRSALVRLATELCQEVTGG